MTGHRPFSDLIVKTRIYREITAERERQDELHPGFPELNDTRFLILAEEIGEVAKDSLESNHENLRKELIESAAVCVRWIEALDKEQ